MKKKRNTANNIFEPRKETIQHMQNKITCTKSTSNKCKIYT